MRKFLWSIFEIFETVAIAAAAVFLIRTFIAQPFLVSGSSMEPAFNNGNYLLVDELTYRFREPARGEVVVFRYPADPSSYFIKRIIGLPGETVEIKDNKITIYSDERPEGFVINESYLPPSQRAADNTVVKLEADQYFVMGDNRTQSFDSRRWGPLKAENIIGLARLRLWPLDEVTAFAAPQYGQ